MKAGVFTVRSDSSRLSVFEAGQPDEKIVARKIETELRKVFNKDINVIIRSLDYLRKLRSAEPFRHIKATPDPRLYVTFLPEKAKSRTISVPFVSAGEGSGFLVLHQEKFSALSIFLRGKERLRL